MALRLDIVENLELNDEQQAGCFNEVVALRRLLLGMDMLYAQTRNMETKAKSVMVAESGEMNVRYGGFGNVPGFKESGVDLLAVECLFDWYSINATRFYDLIGHIAQAAGVLKRTGKSYRDDVCGPVNVYRNKVGAHYALTDQRKQDNIANQQLSIMHKVTFENGRFWVGALSLSVGDSEATHTSQHNYRWALTEFHETVVRKRLGLGTDTQI